MSDTTKSSRRSFVKSIASGSAGISLFPLLSYGRHNKTKSSNEKSDITFVHLADMHVMRQRKGDEGYKRCVDEINTLNPKPDFVLMGGDGPFTGLYTEIDEFEDQVSLFKSISNQLEMPHYHCIGNHDCLGLHENRKVSPDHPEIGKKFIMNRLGMERSYYSFNVKNWHFVVLDCIQETVEEHGPGFIPEFGEEQLEWLRYDLGRNFGMPTVIVTHIAVFCNVGQILGNPDMKSMHDRVVQDGRSLREILQRHNVKVVLQAHSHIIEDYNYKGIWYVTSQAVSGSWWGGDWNLGFGPGYTVFGIKDENITWGRRDFQWEPHLEPDDTFHREQNERWRTHLNQQQKLLEEEKQASVN